MVLKEVVMNSNTSREEALATHPEGRNFRPSFHALWHLEHLNVVNDLTSFHAPSWDTAQSCKPPVVVVIDTPMDVEHPNLKPQISKALMRDFSVLNDGGFPIKTSLLSPKEVKERSALIQMSNAASSDPANLQYTSDWAKAHTQMAATILSEICGEEIIDESLRKENGKRSSILKQVPGAHGTAVAGLIAGVPSIQPQQTAAYLGETVKPADNLDAYLPYAGINPYATIVPVTLTAAPYPDMVLNALNYIEAIQPNVIVIAAAWADAAMLTKPEDPVDTTWPMEQNESDVPFGQSNTDSNSKPRPTPDYALWQQVSEKLVALSHTSVVLCAAGNVSTSQLVYPACLCTKDGNKVWAITACDDDGGLLSYAPPLREGARMLMTLSTQLPRSDREKVVIDPYDAKLPELIQSEPSFEKVGARDLITLDPQGRQGYNPTEYPSPDNIQSTPFLEIGSLYTRFSGTSAATAIAGGLVSLALTTARDSEDKTAFDPKKTFDLKQAQAFVRHFDLVE
jgi:subtilisin family serine protease